MTQPSASFYFPAPRAQNFCSQCGSKLTRLVPPDDNRMRDVCEHCGAVHYQNPRNVVGIVPMWGDDQILLCRRAIEPRYNTWTLPAGFMELGETLGQGALREMGEEAGAQVEPGPLFTVISVPYAEQVHVYYLAKVISDVLDPGPESLEARFFHLDDIPWDNLAFRTVTATLERYVEDHKAGRFQIHEFDIAPRDHG